MIKNIPVVDDIAESRLKLIEDYNKNISKDEIQKQYLLKVIFNY